jgi:hypothetical protein
MSLAPLSGLFVGLVLALLGMIPDEKHASRGDTSIYRQPRKYACVFFVCGVLFASIPWWGPLLAPGQGSGFLGLSSAWGNWSNSFVPVSAVGATLSGGAERCWCQASIASL